MIEVEIGPDQRRKLELVAAHRKACVIELRDLGGGKFLAVVRKG
jgi:hypothetical protein